MRDFAHKSSTRHKKKSLGAWIKAGISFFLNFFRFLLTGIGLIIFLCLLLWLFLPSFFSVEDNINIVFVNTIESEHNKEILFALLEAEPKKLKIVKLDSDHEATLFNLEQNSQDSVSLSQLLAQKKQTGLQTKHWSWLTGRVVERQLQTSLTNFTKARLMQALGDDLLANFSLNNLDYFIENLQLLLSIRQAELEVLDFKTQLPQSTVLPRNCSVAVINTTGISGYAQHVTHIFENSGARVIRVDSSPQDQTLSHSMLAIDITKPDCQQLGQQLHHHFFIQQPVLADSEQADSLLNRYRADLIFLLSADQLFWGNSL